MQQKGKEQSKPFLELEAVSAGYNGNIALDQVNLAIYPQDFIGMIGPNGGGKTTLLKVILGLLPPMKGKVHYYFENTDRPGSQIGYLPQQTLFDQKFPITVGDVILGGLVARTGLLHRFSKASYRQVQETMERLGILGLRQRPLGELSGGELQRTFLARALVASPRLLLLDEPDTFVDTTFASSFYELLQQINQQVAIVLVSHDLGMISSHVKSIACVNRRLHYHGSSEITQEILDSYNCPIELISHGKVPHRVLKGHDHA